MTPSQEKAIMYNLWKRPDSIPETEWITIDQWKAIKDRLLPNDTSYIIRSFREGQHKRAIQRLLNII